MPLLPNFEEAWPLKNFDSAPIEPGAVVPHRAFTAPRLLNA
jgi:hypothetical protein